VTDQPRSTAIPPELEKIMPVHPEIAQSAVVGRADSRLGEVGHAARVSILDEPALIACCSDNAASYKAP
jgi:acyl-CoA synthetase (AMP-forming)/AMP-acid ligase II